MRRTTLIVCLLLFTQLTFAQTDKLQKPGRDWQIYNDVEDAGYSTAKLDSAKRLFDTSKGAALFVVHQGRVLLSLGETNRRFMCASMRKSFMSALIGIAAANQQIDLSETLESLNIDDIQPLSKTERTATLTDLLAARSGVYHPAAFSPKGMAANLPPRGSHLPGDFWYYNNWDFNVLVSIYEQKTETGIFDAFDKLIAKPLQMNDFKLEHTYYCYERKISNHPAYLFRMTARDMARFGLLYLNNGKWGNQQIISEEWIKKSTEPISRDIGAFADRGAYGYLWWISNPIRDINMYFASGVGGQKIAVLPEADLVIVHLANSYQFQNVRHGKFLKLVETILDARVTPAINNPRVTSLQMPTRAIPETMNSAPDDLSKLEGTYRHRILGASHVKVKGDMLELEVRVGKFQMLPTSPLNFWIPDIELPAVFAPAPSPDMKYKAKSVIDDNREATSIVLYF
ncbi:MAG: serine hydrolase domain-containing protein [Calditrichia bacterium]